jgi:Tol biopolymer transport system component
VSGPCPNDQHRHDDRGGRRWGSLAFGGSSATLSANGRYVAFVSADPNLIGAGHDTNGTSDVFRHDLVTGETIRVSVIDGGGQSAGPISTSPAAISSDGRYVAFISFATDLVGPGVDGNGGPDAFIHDTVTHTTERAARTRSTARR